MNSALLAAASRYMFRNCQYILPFIFKVPCLFLSLFSLLLVLLLLFIFLGRDAAGSVRFEASKSGEEIVAGN